jgi:IS5 family transposase
MFACLATDDFFRSRIDHMIDLRHPLAVLSSRMPWQQIEASLAVEAKLASLIFLS